MTTIASSADQAFRAGRRRRAARGAVENGVDGLLASGGMLMANAMLELGMGLPEGAAGVSLGASFLVAGFAWLTRNRRRSESPQRRTRAVLAQTVAPVIAAPIAPRIARRAA
jgi:hypothetical protein